MAKKKSVKEGGEKCDECGKPATHRVTVEYLVQRLSTLGVEDQDDRQFELCANCADAHVGCFQNEFL